MAGFGLNLPKAGRNELFCYTCLPLYLPTVGEPTGLPADLPADLPAEGMEAWRHGGMEERRQEA
ncbi:MAG: hypothetical protein CVT99_05105 [Bacteroidetes bacterium HGW-Bacteroidetes-16]|jgi:hypothetical protein|nr:MAG: hypothetical protein CVT99_05105 [Bacteroidetes bacterium HGW-Bacteroidetes-16]